MITLKQVEKDERWALKVVSNFANKYPYTVTFLALAAFIFVLMSLMIIMLLAAIGGGHIETNSVEMFMSGQITAEQFNTNMWVVDVAAWHYNFLLTLINFAVGGIILALIYFVFKEYLKYKRDNL